MFPSSGNPTTSLQNNLLRFQCSSQNRPRSFYLIPGCEEKIIGKENPADASKGALGGCHQLPCKPPSLTAGHALSKGNKGACLNVMGKAQSCDPKEGGRQRHSLCSAEVVPTLWEQHYPGNLPVVVWSAPFCPHFTEGRGCDLPLSRRKHHYFPLQMG